MRLLKKHKKTLSKQYRQKIYYRGEMVIRSMTGYGRGENIGIFSWVVELRSVNHRYLDIYVRLPKPWLFLEEKIKNYVKGKIKRGRVDVFVNLKSESVPTEIKIDKNTIENYYKKLVEIKNEIG